MSNPVWAPPAPEFVTTPGEAAVVTAGDAPAEGVDGEHTDATEHARHHARGERRLRVPREARVGIAVSLSFALLVTVLVLNRGGKGKTPPVNEIPGKGGATTKNDQDKPTADAEASADEKAAAPVVQADAAAKEKPSGDATPETVAPPKDATAPAEEKEQPVAALPPAEAVPAAADAPPAPSPAVATVPPPTTEEKGDSAVEPQTSAPPEAVVATPLPELPPAASDAEGKSEVPAPVTIPAATPVAEEAPEPNKPLAAPEAPAPVGIEPRDSEPLPAAEPVKDLEAPGPAPTPLPEVSPVSELPAASPAPAEAPPAPGPSTPIAPAAEPLPRPETPEERPAAPALGPEPVTRTDAATPAAPRSDPSGVLPAANPVGGQAGWVKLPKTRLRTSNDRPTALATARAPVNPTVTREAPLPDHADRIEPIPHVVQPGENFWTISRLYYRSGRYYKALWAANKDKVPDPKVLYIGTTIRVPPQEALDPALVLPPKQPVERASATPVPLQRASRPVLSSSGAATPSRATVQGSRPLPSRDSFDEVPPPRRAVSTTRQEQDAEDSLDDESPRPRRPRYRVRSRYETIRSIAKRTLGDAHRDEEILKLNRKVIQDPFHLTPGQYLELPEDARVAGIGP